ncbi:MAG: M50 family metallopeptidase, partial [Lysobacter sp.]
RGYGIAWTWLAIFLPGLVLAVTVHECGHWAAARWRGMIVSQVVIGWLEIQPRRRGVRLRLVRGMTSGVRGYVLAYPGADRDMRRDLTWFALGGPIASLFAAVGCGMVAWQLGRSSAQSAWLLWGLLHLLGCVLNLIPRKLSNAMATDGLIWARARLNRFDALPGAAFLEIQGRILRGAPVRDLPTELLRRLLDEPEPMPSMHGWLWVHAALEAQDLDDADKRFEALRARIGELDPPMQLALAGLLAMVRVDLAFAHAIEQGEGGALTALDPLSLDAPGYWYAPHVPPRVRALAAALRGDAVEARRQLARAQRYAENSPCDFIVLSEAQLRERIEAIIERSPPSSSASRQTA